LHYNYYLLSIFSYKNSTKKKHKHRAILCKYKKKKKKKKREMEIQSHRHEGKHSTTTTKRNTPERRLLFENRAGRERERQTDRAESREQREGGG
jgi:hypothetical protein